MCIQNMLYVCIAYITYSSSLEVISVYLTPQCPKESAQLLRKSSFIMAMLSVNRPWTLDVSYRSPTPSDPSCFVGRFVWPWLVRRVQLQSVGSWLTGSITQLWKMVQLQMIYLFKMMNVHSYVRLLYIDVQRAREKPSPRIFGAFLLRGVPQKRFRRIEVSHNCWLVIFFFHPKSPNW